MAQQVNYARNISDAINIKAMDVTGGYFPTGADPVKYSPAIAYSTAMLSWGLTQFDQGFKDSASTSSVEAVEVSLRV